MKYNKLVRDKIIDIIEGKGETATYRIANEQEYWTKLKEKLVEEVEEFLEAESPEELADVLEVIEAMQEMKKISPDSVTALQKKKRDERGGFTKRIILEET